MILMRRDGRMRWRDGWGLENSESFFRLFGRQLMVGGHIYVNQTPEEFSRAELHRWAESRETPPP